MYVCVCIVSRCVCVIVKPLSGFAHRISGRRRFNSETREIEREIHICTLYTVQIGRGKERERERGYRHWDRKRKNRENERER